MGLFIKKYHSKATKFFGIIFFLILMLVNLQISLNPKSHGNIDLMGVKLSLFSTAYAASESSSGGGGGKPSYCYVALYNCRNSCLEFAAGQTAGCALFVWNPPVYEYCMQGVTTFLLGCEAGCYIGFMNCG